jgi:ubiquinone/menaquinone biosynthesis C-methylase UbiE
MNINKPDNINEMYVKNDTLSTRQNLHDKYSVNKYGWHNWVFDQYKFRENMNVLELGCGIGSTWIGKEKQIPSNASIILTDISPLMIEKAKEKLGTLTNFSFQVMDIQNIPFEDEKFDMIIANHMLYHVPDITKALSELKRILKNDGCFYTTTIGKDSLKELQDIYRNYDNKVKFQYSKDCSFTLENGEKILKPCFGKIEKVFYEDSLEVTDANDLMDYIISYNKVPKEIYNEMYEIIKTKFNEDGIFRIRKDQGMFICRL